RHSVVPMLSISSTPPTGEVWPGTGGAKSARISRSAGAQAVGWFGVAEGGGTAAAGDEDPVPTAIGELELEAAGVARKSADPEPQADIGQIRATRSGAVRLACPAWRPCTPSGTHRRMASLHAAGGGPWGLDG
ncbi:MAG: hypothetical protein ABIM89_00170, partial [Mycobacteriales bacterium]